MERCCLKESFVPLTTPFYPDGRLNLRKLEHNVDRYTRTPAAGMIALGANGEATTLDDAETREALGIAIGAAGAEKVMWAGVARDGVAATLGMIEHAAGVGYDVRWWVCRGAGWRGMVSGGDDVVPGGGGSVGAASGACE